MYKKIILGIILVFFVFYFGTGFMQGNTSLDLKEGKNNVEFLGINPFFVKDLIKLNPGVEVVSYVEGDRTMGYANIFEGVGKNFVIRDGEYEIITKEDITLILPPNTVLDD